ncbi:5-methylcytosine-specific restriction endonuclease McrA [Pseudorhizobium tarimense]|uniref:5-methylcytosine-specific restriction endonuclease McrA n=1 Tax=Pseudorhizobium tarimense TaxID=1079109 RepID=A0ABV2H5D1_9HYPH|nr:HNH endonuclease [Pseudorhizobium tarimense]MCJ8518970.1 HNH endonuclease [Pseudorhizobium tarimense]
MARSVEEWIGKTDDTKVPPRVRLRIFERENGICHLTGQKIQPGDEWDLEHKVALILGGQHRETNLFPALQEAHRRKTAMEMKVKSKIARVKKKHLGITKPKSSLSHTRFKRLMDGTVVNRDTGEIVGGRQQ